MSTATAFSSNATARTVNVSDLVWYAHKPMHAHKPDALEVCPAIVLRINIPSDPQSPIALVVFSLSVGMKFLFAVPRADEPTADHWCLPRPGEIPEPVFANTREHQAWGVPQSAYKPPVYANTLNR